MNPSEERGCAVIVWSVLTGVGSFGALLVITGQFLRSIGAGLLVFSVVFMVLNSFSFWRW